MRQSNSDIFTGNQWLRNKRPGHKLRPLHVVKNLFAGADFTAPGCTSGHHVVQCGLKKTGKGVCMFTTITIVLICAFAAIYFDQKKKQG